MTDLPMSLLSEGVDRARSSFKMILLCTMSWTAIAATFLAARFWMPSVSNWVSAWVPKRNRQLTIKKGLSTSNVRKVQKRSVSEGLVSS